MRTLVLALSAATLTVPALAVPITPAVAQNASYHGKTWRGSDGRTYCRKSNGTTGLIVGGAAGRPRRPGDRQSRQPHHRHRSRRRGRSVARPPVQRNVVSKRRCR